ncbi:hypothetical protein DY000_02014790 [Brassica cretica]|uniref:Uncharacterized protein n=1 Tax=Brassica cretica TaxID=69181 RepID=A0ABQ7D5J4_BRACR|nr:hypothetical protein DY000_02014790 [Brassica cretica]
MGLTNVSIHGTPMKPDSTLHLPSRLSWPLRVESGLLPSLLVICVCYQDTEEAKDVFIHDQTLPMGRCRRNLGRACKGTDLPAFYRRRGGYILTIASLRSYGLTGVSPRTKVCPDDTIQDRGCYRDEERWRSNDLCVCECSGSSNCGSGDGGMLPSCLTERPEDIRFVFLTLEASSC